MASLRSGVTGEAKYHHGNLRAAVIAAAVQEVEAVGAAAVSMREIARRAGVSHAAPTHHFGDKTGLFTAIATEGFLMAADAISPAATGRFGFLDGGAAYVAFALAHPGYFEVMYRPALYHVEDPELVQAREAAFAVLDTSAAAMASLFELSDADSLSVAGWSLAHGLATLLLAGNLSSRVSTDPGELTAMFTRGIVGLGKVARARLDDGAAAL